MRHTNQYRSINTIHPITQLVVEVINEQTRAISYKISPYHRHHLVHSNRNLKGPRIIKKNILIIYILIDYITNLLTNIRQLRRLTTNTQTRFRTNRRFQGHINIRLTRYRILSTSARISITPRHISLTIRLSLLSILTRQLTLLTTCLINILSSALGSTMLISPLHHRPITSTKRTKSIINDLTTRHHGVQMLHKTSVMLILRHLQHRILRILRIVPKVRRNSTLISRLRNITITKRRRHIMSKPLPRHNRHNSSIITLMPLLFSMNSTRHHRRLLSRQRLNRRILQHHFTNTLMLQRRLITRNTTLRIRHSHRVIKLLTIRRLKRRHNRAPCHIHNLSNLDARVFHQWDRGHTRHGQITVSRRRHSAHFHLNIITQFTRSPASSNLKSPCLTVVTVTEHFFKVH